MLFCVLILGNLLSFVMASKPNMKTQTLLLLNSYHRGFKWSDDITDAVLTEFRDSTKYHVFVEYMDSKRFQSEGYFDQLHTLYYHKYTSFPIDGIICSDNNALDFVISHGDSIWGNVPVVFCGINDVANYKNRIDTLRFNGVEERIDILSTIRFAKKLQPDLKEFIVVGDRTLMYPIFFNQFKQAIDSSGLKLSYKEVIVETADQLNAALQSENLNGKAIYLLSLYLNNHGFAREMSTEAKSVFANIDVPVYSNWDFLIPDLIVGGRLLAGTDQGRLAANIMHRRLKNETEPIPFSVLSPQKFMFDHEQLKRFSFDRKALPKEKIIFNKDKGIFDRYQTEMLVILGFFISLLCIIGLLGSVILFRRKAERELIESENRLELALEGANQGLWDIDLKSGTFFINKQVAFLLGYQSPKALGVHLNNWTDFFHPNDFIHLQEAIYLHKMHKSPSINCEVRMRTFEGKYKWISIHGKITEWENDLPMRYTGSMINIDEQKEFEDQLRLAKEKAEESDRLKSSFLANMSHEIRTPMNAILGFADLVTTDLLTDEERKVYLQQIKSSGETLLTLINDIIDISKIESEQLVIIPELFNLDQLLEKIERMGNTLIINARKHIQLHVHRKGNDSASYIFSDPMRLEQVLLNLLTNAIKFTKKGEIEISYQYEDFQTIAFSVRDTGIGIADEFKSIIFERFRQGDETLAKRFGGNGLGLTISRSLVKMLGGDIQVQSQPGKGSVFTFTIRTVKNEVLA